MPTPNMGLTLPGPNITPGPTWAIELNGDMSLLDSHDHTVGSGAPLSLAAMGLLAVVAPVDVSASAAALGASNLAARADHKHHIDAAAAGVDGIVTTLVQTFDGNKTFSGTIAASNFSGASSGTNTGDVTIGLASGLSLLGQILSLALATPATPGAMSAADKTFLDDQSGVNTGDVTLAAVGAAPSANGATLAGQVLTLQPADGTRPGVVTAGIQSFGGNKTFLGTIAASNFSGTFSGTSSGTNTGDVTIGTANGLSLLGQALSLALAIAGGANGALAGTDKTKLDNTSGTNSGDVSLTAVGAAPSANGATLAGQALTLQPADATRPGVVTELAQTFGGAKTFASTVAAAAPTAIAMVPRLIELYLVADPSEAAKLTVTYSTGLVSVETWARGATGAGNKLKDVAYTYTTGSVTTIVTKVYDTNGTTVLGQTTETLVYNPDNTLNTVSKVRDV